MIPPPPQPFETCFDQAWPARDWCDAHVVLAVSAGPDSVAMLRAALALRQQCGGSGRLYVAHLNHALRGAEADADATWLETHCQRLNVPLVLGKADVARAAAQRGDGLEAAAREERYAFLQTTAEKIGARFVAVAHTADDQVETVLHRILRGTGLAGLAGISKVRSLTGSLALVRPLLGVRRRDVLDYLAAIGQDFRVDSSNASLRWTRSRLRHKLLPKLREDYNCNVDVAILRLSAQAAESQQFISDVAAEIARDCVTLEFAEQSDAVQERVVRGARIDCRRLDSQPPLMIREVCKLTWTSANWPLQEMGFDQWQQLAAMVRGKGDMPTVNLPSNIRARIEDRSLVLEMLGLS